MYKTTHVFGKLIQVVYGMGKQQVGKIGLTREASRVSCTVVITILNHSNHSYIK